ncbi:MAG: hypothetical protein QF464_04170, partial [Myxococcota bacterium]|nr:hypothetical protein [Myxococcota bacterium]
MPFRGLLVFALAISACSSASVGPGGSDGISADGVAVSDGGAVGDSAGSDPADQSEQGTEVETPPDALEPDVAPVPDVVPEADVTPDPDVVPEADTEAALDVGGGADGVVPIDTSVPLCLSDEECDDGDLCNGVESCDGATGCQAGEALSCDDGVFCNGVESCDGATGCQQGDPVQVDDEIACTDDACDEELDLVTHTVNQGACETDTPCVDDLCVPEEGGCVASPLSPTSWCSDEDDDGLGAAGTEVAVCDDESPPPGHVVDCTDPEPDCPTDDTDVCGLCGGPGPPVWYADPDGDGAGDPESAIVSCDAPEGAVATPGCQWDFGFDAGGPTCTACAHDATSPGGQAGCVPIHPDCPAFTLVVTDSEGADGSDATRYVLDSAPHEACQSPARVETLVDGAVTDVRFGDCAAFEAAFAVGDLPAPCLDAATLDDAGCQSGAAQATLCGVDAGIVAPVDVCGHHGQWVVGGLPDPLSGESHVVAAGGSLPVQDPDDCAGAAGPLGLGEPCEASATLGGEPELCGAFETPGADEATCDLDGEQVGCLCVDKLCLRGLGVPCEEDAQCATGHCSDAHGTCRWELGEGCAGDDDCISEVCDDGVCAQGLGGACSADDDCALGLGLACALEDGSPTGTCKLSVAGACVVDDDCQSGVCVDEVCLGRGGDPCSGGLAGGSSLCIQGACFNDVCAWAPTDPCAGHATEEVCDGVWGCLWTEGGCRAGMEITDPPTIAGYTFTDLAPSYTGTSVWRRPIDGGQQPISNQLDDPMAVVYDRIHGHLFFADANVESREIFRSNLDGTDKVSLLTVGKGGAGNNMGPGGLAVDPGAGKLYWLSRSNKRIQRANLDGTEVEDVLYVGGGGEDLTIDLAHGHLYWTDGGLAGIFRATLDGQHVERVGGAWTNRGLALDLVEGRVYWT